MSVNVWLSANHISIAALASEIIMACQRKIIIRVNGASLSWRVSIISHSVICCSAHREPLGLFAALKAHRSLMTEASFSQLSKACLSREEKLTPSLHLSELAEAGLAFLL